MQRLRKVLIIPFLFLLPLTSFASEQTEFRQHVSHVHGIAQLNLALANNELLIEFESPAADIVGFEHEPRNDNEKAAYQKALGILRVGERMFKFPQAAGVRLEKSVVKILEDDFQPSKKMLDPSTGNAQFCSYCGTMLEEDLVFCENCGNKI